MNRLSLSLTWIGTSLLVALTLYSCNHKEVSDDRPNVVLFLVDDLGWQDTSVPFWDSTTHFNRIYETPNMERLASEGMKFTNAYAHAVCSPTRISLMTGTNPARHRVTNWTLEKNTQTDRKVDHLIVPEWNVNGMTVDSSVEKAFYAKPLPQVLQDNGYTTIHCGKAHLGARNTPCADPSNCGFMINIAGHAAGAPGSYNGMTHFGNAREGSPDNNWAVPGLEKYHGQDINLTEALTLEAINTLDSTIIDKGDRFFLYMAHYGVHTPIQEDDRFYHKYLDKGMDTIEARYASMIESMDKSLGDLMDFLERKGLSDETIILFMSDNGGLSAVARGGEKHTHNFPLRSGKGSSLEGGVREPMIVKWPHQTSKGSTTKDLVIIEDFFPTILELCEANTTNIPQVVDGISFTSTLKESDGNVERELFWHMPNFWGGIGPGIGPYSAIRKGNHKLIYYHEDQSIVLYNLRKDISELKDISLEEKELAGELKQRLGDFLRECNAQMPFRPGTKKRVDYP